MIWFGFVVLSLIVMTPFMVSQRRIQLRGRREAALDLYRAQLVELEHDGERGRIGAAEQAQARLEIERRLLATASAVEEVRPSRMRVTWLVPLLVVLLPLAGLALYLPGATPNLPAAPLAPRIAAAEARMREDQAMLGMLQAKIATLDPHGEEARRGDVLLGNLEATLDNPAAASAAWAKALTIRSDPGLAALKAQADAATRSLAPAP